MSSMKIEELENARIQARLKASPYDRALAIAEFPLKVVAMAQDLQRVLRLPSLNESQRQMKRETVDYLTSKIKDEYRRTFGTELGE